MSCVPDTSRGVLASSVPAEALWPSFDFDVGLFRQVVEVENLAALVFQHDLRVQIALVLHDHPADVTAGILFHAHRFAFDHVLVAHLAANFGQNGNAVRIPFAEDLARFDFLVFVDQQIRAGGHFVLFQLAAFGIENHDFAVAGEHDLLAGVVAHDLQPRELHDAGLLGFVIVFFDRTLAAAADVEGTHGQLRARLADALRGDDSHGHAFFDHGSGRKIHAVAQPANAQRGVAGHAGCEPESFPGPTPRCGERWPA